MIKGIVGFGESVVDFIPVGDKDGCTFYKACPGGSVANLCVVAAKQEIPSVFVGGVGNDSFGHYLKERLSAYGVDTSAMVFTQDCGTNLTFVQMKEDGQREYSSVNQPGADKMVSFGQINIDKILQYKVLHVSSNAMASGKTFESEPALLARAKKSGMIISYDVNYRPTFYKTLEDALKVLRIPLEWADIIKVTEEELELLTGGKSMEHARQLLGNKAKLLLLTKGEMGNDYIGASYHGHIDAYNVKAIDTTGAGDCFLGGFLSWMLSRGDVDNLIEEDVRQACVYANKVAGISIQRTGAMASVPTRHEVELLF